ncbi:MAG: nucleoside deaminase [Cyanobacteria bacterium M_surface_7_m2_037]|nr:nucleoside deaminase [Cyanobacteria bacterium M_surface_7_m2_037]MBM5819513.1 nucleoside deaminase [Cyanobacteria bacterium K_DeepCast_150m_m2_101]
MGSGAGIVLRAWADDLRPAEQLLWMQRLLRRAEVVGGQGEIPVAAVVVDGQGRAVGWGSNRREHDQQPLGHAELVALQQAARLRGDWRFNDCTLLVTLEPCPMCAGALVQARVGQVVFGASDPKRGALGGVLDLSTSPTAHHHMQVVGGVEAKQCADQLERWFKQRRRQQRELRSGRPAAPAPAG